MSSYSTHAITKRKFALMVAIAAVLLSSYALMADSTDQTSAEITNGDLAYEILGSDAKVIGLSEEGQYNYSITIPSTIYHEETTYNVTSIDSYAFSNALYLNSISIPNSVTTIGNYAFYGCISLWSVTMPSDVDEISPGTFSGCSSLWSFTIPNNVTRIHSSAFYGCSSLTSITIPDSVTNIFDFAFSGCSSLTSITIPSGVTNIGTGVFTGCTNLTVMSVDSSNVNYSSEGGILYSKDGTTLISCLVSKTGTVTISDDVTTINDYAFAGCSSLTSITIPSGVTNIGDYAFAGCSSLTSITIPSSVNEISPGTFSGCSSLISVTVPSNVTTIGSSAFSGCSSLTSITIPSGVLSIKNNAFSDCSSLTSVSIPGTVTSLEYGAFSYCSKLSSLNLNEGLDSIGDNAFSDCTSLTSVTIPASVTTIGANIFENCINLTEITVSEPVHYYSEDGILYGKGETPGNDVLLLCPAGKSGAVAVASGVSDIGDEAFSGCAFVTSVTISEGVDEIGYSAFYGCDSLTSVDMPSTLNSIGSYAFSNCERLVSADLPGGLTDIGMGAFSYCTALTSVTVPAEVTMISDYAFSGCSSVSSVILPDGITYIGYSAFDYCESLSSINIPSSILNIGDGAFLCTSLTSVIIPGDVGYIGYRAFAECSELTSITVGESAIYEGDSGILYRNDVEDEKTLIQCPAGKTGAVTILDGTTSIGDYAFSGCSSVTSVTIPTSVTYIGDNAFYGCSALDSITIPEGVLAMGESVFEDCTSLVSIDLPSTVGQIGESVTYGCTSLMNIFVAEGNMLCQDIDGVIYSPDGTEIYLCPNARVSVEIPSGVTRINSAFAGCADLVSVTIPDSVSEIGSNAFMGCTSLETIIIPDSVTYISEWMFAGCSSIESVIIPESVTSIGDYAFLGCSSLGSIVIPDSVTNIPESAFAGCSSLASVTMSTEVNRIEDRAFSDCLALLEVDLSSVTYIGDGAFSGCSSLQEADIPVVQHIGHNAFQSCRAIQQVTLSNTVTFVGSGAFADCSSLSGISVATNNAEYSGGESTEYALYSKDMTALLQCPGAATSITIPSTVRYIDPNAFSGCWNLASINVAEGNSVFASYDGILYSVDGELIKCPTGKDGEVIVHEGTVSIGQSAFAECHRITSVSMPSSVVSIGDRAFYVCVSMESADIPSGVKEIGEMAFYGCMSLQTVTVPAGVRVIENSTFAACVSLQSLTILSGVVYIGEEAFVFCMSLQTVSIPGSVVQIDDYAFGHCNFLNNVMLNEGTAVIGEYAFAVCANLNQEAITLPETVQDGYLSDTAFSATWDAGIFVVLYNPNGGTGSSMPSFSFEGSKIDLPTWEGYYKEGKVFGGWSATGSAPAIEGRYVPTGDITLYAIWNDSIMATLAFDLNGGTGTISPINQYTGTTVDLPSGEGLTKDGFEFIGWSATVNGDLLNSTYMILDSATLYAIWNQTYSGPYTVTWNVEGVLYYLQLNAGESPVYSGPTPEKAATDEYTYTFTGWDKPLSPVTGDVTYTAVFDSHTRQYEITWNIEGDTTVTYLNYGTNPVYSGTPTKASTLEFDFEFSGWTPSLVSVTGNITYTAQFNEIQRSYNVTWVIEGESTVTSYLYGTMPTHSEPFKEDNEQYWYSFDRWTPDIVAVADNATYTAVFETHLQTYEYDYDLNGGDGTPPSGGSIDYGSILDLASGEGLTKTGHTFVGWSLIQDGAAMAEPYSLTGDVTFYAVWEIDTYLITWVIGEGSISETYDYGETPSYPETVSKPSDAQYDYVFTVWTPVIVPVTEDETYTANFNSNLRTYNFGYDLNGGDGTPPSGGSNFYGSVVPSQSGDGLTKIGHTFGGWSDSAEGIAVEDPYTLTGDVTFYAVWNVNQYTLTFSINEATGTAPDAITADYGSVVSLPGVGDMSKEGYIFGGWSETADGTAVTLPYRMPLDGDTLYAIWNPPSQATVAFDSNGGTGTVSSIEQDTGTSLVLPDGSGLTKDGYTFGGWSEYLNGSALSSYMITGDATLYAVWGVNQYTLNFDVNGATGTIPSEITADYGSVVTLPVVGDLDRPGFTFGGWSETLDGMAVTLPYSMPLNGKTLYAVWGINQYTVTFNANGATGDTPAPITADYNSVVTLSGVGGMSKEGYTFGGWSETADGTAVTLPYRMPLDGDILYAIWISPSPATLSFDLNGGSGNVPPINGYTGTIVALPSGSGATRQGYTFLGWSAYPDGEILPTSYMITGNATIYAVWTVNQYILDFLPNGAEGSPSTIYADYDSEVTLPGVGDMSKVGYTFGGWSETVDGTAVTLPYRMPFGGGSLYAVWNINQYRITWNWTTEAGPQTITEDLDYDTYPVKMVPGYQTETDVFTFSTWSPDTEPVSADATYTAQYTSVPRLYNVTWYVDGDGTTTAVAFGAVISLPNDPTKTGYTFGGWSPALPATMPANDISVNATWTINRYTVIFDPNGATGEVPALITADYNSEVTLPGVGSLVLTGYIFEGWSETSDGAVISGTYRMPSGDKTLYASWVLDQCTLTFNANGASSGTVPSSITKSYGLEVTLPSLVDLSKTGHTFGGWSLIADGTAIESPYTMTGNVTLYAVWNINKYTLSFNANGAEGTAPPSSDNDYNSVVTLPTAGSLHKTGHSFSGWSETAEGEAVTEPYTMPLGGKTLYAVWTVNQYTITFVSDGSTVPAITQDYGTAITSPAAPTRTGYTFGGWSPALPATMPGANTTATAQWTINQYTISFSANGATGAVPAAITGDYDSTVPLPEAGSLAKAGYAFGGWSHNPGGSTLLTPYKVNTDETLYAVWNIITYDELPDSEVISDIISQDDEPVLQVKGNAADQVLDNTIFQSIGDKPLTVDVVDDEGQVQYSWTFEGDYKSEAGTFKAGISEVTPEGDLSGAITSTGAENPLVLNFAASGELPINATVKYYVGDKYENGTKLTLFFYNETTKQLEEKAKDLVVTDGWVTLSLTHCSSYVLAEPAPASTPEDSTMLYIGIGAAAAAILGAVAFFIIRRR